jgi:hypothetical protein
MVSPPTTAVSPRRTFGGINPARLARRGPDQRNARDADLKLLSLGAAQSGAVWGFASTLLAALLVHRGVPVATFFAPFAITLAAVRFVGMGRLQRLPPAYLAALGVLCSSLGLVLLEIPAAAGALVGFGHAVIMPAAIEWSSRRGPGKRPVALMNAYFNIGAIAAIEIA